MKWNRALNYNIDRKTNLVTWRKQRPSCHLGPYFLPQRMAQLVSHVLQRPWEDQ